MSAVWSDRTKAASLPATGTRAPRGIPAAPRRELQTPTDYSGIYATWNVDLDGDGVLDDPWDFGTRTQYPVLAVDADRDGRATWQEFGYQLRDGPTLTASGGRWQAWLSWTAVDTSHWNPAPVFTLHRQPGHRLVGRDHRRAAPRPDSRRYPERFEFLQ